MICVRYLETVDCRIFVIRSPWLWRYTGEGVNLESVFVKSALRSLDGDKYHFCCTYREGWYCGSQSSGTRLKKIGLGKVHLFPNNSVPPAGPSFLTANAKLSVTTHEASESHIWISWVAAFPGRREEHVWRDLVGGRGWNSPRFLDFPAERLFPWVSSNCLLELMPKHIGRIWITFCVAGGKQCLERNSSAEVLEVEVVKVVLEGVDS